MLHGYTHLEVKHFDIERRIITGIASTPTIDRQGHSLDPLGAQFAATIPLLLHHDSKQPVGTVMLSATPAGLAFRAEIPQVTEPGPLKDRLDETFQAVKAGLLKAVSVGYRILEGGAERLANGLLRLKKTEICEVSLTTMPVNPEAVILSVKSLAPELYAPAAPRRQESTMATITAAEHIQNIANKRAAHIARMGDLMRVAADENRTLQDAEATEHDGLAAEVKSFDADLARWRTLEQLQITTATPVPAVPAAMPFGHVSVKANVEPGITLARYVIAKMVARYEGCDAAAYAASRWNDSTPEVALALKAAVGAGSTTDATWAKPLVNPSISADFLPLLRAATILGKIKGLYEVPFNVTVPSQTGGGTINWVGELKPKPVTAMAFASESLGFSKVAAISVLSQELVRFSNPSAERVVRDSLVKDIALFLDGQFTNPAVAAVAGVNPASITNGAATAAATTNPLADIVGLINHFATFNIPVSGLHILMSPSNALSMAFRTNLDGTRQFPGVTMDGGQFNGITILTSTIIGSLVIALQPSLILYADDGGVTIDASTEASLQMDSAPMSPVDATTVYASMFQMNAVALRAERYINWKRIGTNSVKYLTAASWPAPTAAAAPEAPPA